MTKHLAEALAAEDGHWQSGSASLVAAVGAIALGIGAANDTGWLAITGGILTGVGLLAAAVLHHQTVDYELFRRTDKSA